MFIDKNELPWQPRNPQNPTETHGRTNKTSFMRGEFLEIRPFYDHRTYVSIGARIVTTLGFPVTWVLGTSTMVQFY